MDLGADESLDNRQLLRLWTAEVNLRSEDLASPRSDLADKQVAGGGCQEIMRRDEDILTLNVNGEALEEEMECEPEDETVQDAERVKTPSQIQDSPARKNVRSTRQHMRSTELAHCVCERTWNRDEAPQEHRCRTSFVMDYCFPSQGRPRRSAHSFSRTKVPTNTLSKQ